MIENRRVTIEVTVAVPADTVGRALREPPRWRAGSAGSTTA